MQSSLVSYKNDIKCIGLKHKDFINKLSADFYSIVPEWYRWLLKATIHIILILKIYSYPTYEIHSICSLARLSIHLFLFSLVSNRHEHKIRV